MIVADTNLVSYLFLQGDYSAIAEAALRQDPDWFAPPLWRSEFQNVLALYLWKNLLTIEDAIAIFHKAEKIFQGKMYQVNVSDVLHLAATHKHPAYDCEFVALAKELDTKLVTMNKKILRSFPETAVSLRDFVKSKNTGEER